MLHQSPNKYTTLNRLQRIFQYRRLIKPRFIRGGNQLGMSVTELMVAICITAILAAVAIPSYISYVQQARVVSLVIPRLHLVESSIGHFYSMNNRLPGSADLDEILASINAENLEIKLTNGALAMTIRASEKKSKLHILDGNMLLASPILTKDKIVGWHLTGELADRLKISY